MSTAAFTPIAHHPVVSGIFLLVLAALTLVVLRALGDYLGWLSVKNHQITDPALLADLEGVKPPAYLGRLLFWLALWMIVASACKALL